MKLVIAVVEDEDATPLMDTLLDRNFRATKLASTGGFLLQGNTTLLIGVEENEVDDVIGIIRKTCVRRKKLLSQTASDLPAGVHLPIEIEAGGAIIFTVDVDEFYKL